MTDDAPYSNIVILGHTGFIGSRIFEKFRQASTGIEVHGISSSTVDLTRWEQVQSLADKLDDRSAVIMCAGIKPHVEESLDAFHKNMAMAYNVARLLQEHPVKQCVYFSSISVYGESMDQLDLNEESPINPGTYYGIAKYASEGIFYKVSEGLGSMSLVILRPSLVYGAGNEKEHYGSAAFSRSLISQGSVTLWGDGSELRDFVYVEDVAALTWAMTFGGCGGIYNVVSGETHSFRDILEIIQPLHENQVQVNNKDRTRLKVNQGFSADKLLEAVPDFAPTSFQEGISKTFNHIRSTYSGVEASGASAQ